MIPEGAREAAVETTRRSYLRGGPAKVLEGSGFHPPAVVLVACALVAVGLLVLAVGTPVLELPGRQKLDWGIHLFKALVGLVLIGGGYGLYRMEPWSRPFVLSAIAIGGVLVPLYPWQSQYIDWEFTVAIRYTLVLASLVVIGYLLRSSVAHAFEHRGVPVDFEGYYCAGCNAPYEAYRGDGCEHCGGPLHRLYRSPGGVAYAPFFDGGICGECGREDPYPESFHCQGCGARSMLLLYRFPGGATRAVED